MAMFSTGETNRPWWWPNTALTRWRGHSEPAPVRDPWLCTTRYAVEQVAQRLRDPQWATDGEVRPQCPPHGVPNVPVFPAGPVVLPTNQHQYPT